MIPSPVRTVAVIDDDRRVLTSLENLLASGAYGVRAYESPQDFFADDYACLVCVITDMFTVAMSVRPSLAPQDRGPAHVPRLEFACRRLASEKYSSHGI